VGLLVHQGLLLQEMGDWVGAEQNFRTVLETPISDRLSGIDLGMQGYKTRHALAQTLHAQGRLAEARAEWEQVLIEQPAFAPAQQGLEQLQREMRTNY